ncbi:MAG: hypothetical protein ACK4VV_16625 [Pseudomonas sp.]
MHRQARFTVSFALTVLVSGCALMPSGAPPSAERLTGLLEISPEAANVAPCAGGEQLALDNAGEVRALFERVAQPGQTAIFVDLNGRRNAQGGFAVDQVLRMQSAGRGCADQAYQSSQWLALGDAPYWQVRIGAQGMQWQDTVEDVLSAPIPLITEQVPGGTLSFQTLRGDQRELWITPQPCFDQGSGDYYHASVRLITAGSSQQGCAYQGAMQDSRP